MSLNVRRLVEVDFAFLGPRLIVAEFAAGVAGCLLLGVVSLTYAVRMHAPVWSWPVVLGLELAAAGVNYIPLLAEAVRRRGDAAAVAATRAAIRENSAEPRSYGVRQLWILVPGAVVFFALKQRNPTSLS